MKTEIVFDQDAIVELFKKHVTDKGYKFIQCRVQMNQFWGDVKFTVEVEDESQ